MKIRLVLLLALTCVSLRAQTQAPEEVTASAVKAVEALGKRVVYGDHAAAVERMNPRWKKRLAKRLGGEKQIQDRLKQVGQEMAKRGVSIISFKTVGEPTAYEVWPGRKKPGAEGPAYDKWMLFIPTRIQFRMIEGDPPRTHVINSYGFQVAISEKGKNDWTFIDGSEMSVSDLRSLFSSLPANLELPLVKRELAE